MKKIIIVIFLLSLSSNSYASRGELLLEFFSSIGKIFETRTAMVIGRTLPRWFLKNDTEVNKFERNTYKDYVLDFDEYILKKDLNYNEDLNKITNYDFNIDPNYEQAKSISILKKYINTYSEKIDFEKDNFFLFCEYKNQLYSFLFFKEQNYVTMNKSITPFYYLEDQTIDSEALIGVSSKSKNGSDILTFTSFKDEANKSFENWYYFFLYKNDLKFIHVIGEKGDSKINKIEIEFFDTDRCDVLQSYTLQMVEKMNEESK